MSKFLEFVSFFNSVFYGNHWFIAWGIVLLLFVPVIISETPKFIKSIKTAKIRKKNK